MIADTYPPVWTLLANAHARMARAGRWAWPPGLAVCAQPVPGVQHAATGKGAHPQSVSNVEDFPFVEDQPS